MLPHLIYRLAPVLVFAVGAFSLFHAWGVVRALQAGNLPFALFYGVFAVGGVALGVALWRARMQVDRKRRELDEPQG